MPFVYYVDADGVTRIYNSLNWLENPTWIKSGNWGPVYFYIMGFALTLFHNQIFTPLIVNILFSIATLFPLFFFIKRLYNESTALILCFLFSLSPIIFRLSLLSLSETSFMFFVILSACFLLKGIDEKKIFCIFLGGLAASIAGGIRYESWILSALFSFIIFFKYSRKYFFVFSVTAFLFPVIWLISNFNVSGNLFNSFNWAVVALDTNKFYSIESLLRRIWFYPLSLIFAFGPIAMFFFIKSIINTYKLKTYKKPILIFCIVFLIILSVFLYNTIRGSLLMQHRFTITLFLICLPLFGFYFTKLSKKKIYLALLFAFSGLVLSYAYSSKGTRPVPQLLNKDAKEINNIIRTNVKNSSGLIIDFWNWENTYCLAFMSELPRKNIVLFENDKDKNVFFNEIKEHFVKYTEGFFLLNNNSRLLNDIDIQNNSMIIKKADIQISVVLIKKSPDVTLYKYKSK